MFCLLSIVVDCCLLLFFLGLLFALLVLLVLYCVVAGAKVQIRRCPPVSRLCIQRSFSCKCCQKGKSTTIVTTTKDQ